MQDLMIDLETLGTSANAPVISLGAAYFDINTKQMGDTFYMVCDVADQIDSRIRPVDADTIKFWMHQSGAAKRVFKEGHQPTKVVLETFRKWVMEHAGSKAASFSTKVKPWGNGSSFDITIMETLFDDYKVAVPWAFWQVMDLRTYRRFIGKGAKVPKLEGVEHNALDDCINQINYVFEHSGNLNNV